MNTLIEFKTRIRYQVIYKHDKQEHVLVKDEPIGPTLDDFVHILSGLLDYSFQLAPGGEVGK